MSARMKHFSRFVAASKEWKDSRGRGFADYALATTFVAIALWGFRVPVKHALGFLINGLAPHD